MNRVAGSSAVGREQDDLLDRPRPPVHGISEDPRQEAGGRPPEVVVGVDLGDVAAFVVKSRTF